MKKNKTVDQKYETLVNYKRIVMILSIFTIVTSVISLVFKWSVIIPLLSFLATALIQQKMVGIKGEISKKKGK